MDDIALDGRAWRRFHRRRRRALFQGWCGYCRRREATTVDHFIPRRLGGRDVPENWVGCCWQCNADKGCARPQDWYKRQSFFSFHRWLQILVAVGEPERAQSNPLLVLASQDRQSFRLNERFAD